MAENDENGGSGDHSEQGRSERPSLAQIEAEGRAAANATAEELIREMLKNGGQINVERLETFGPDVHREYDRILSEGAVAASKAKSDVPPAKTASSQATSKATSERKPPAVAPTTKAPVVPRRQPLPPRVKTGWQELRRPEWDFATIAFVRGLTAASVLGFLAILAMYHFNF
ncbi:MAG: hypothetical protein ABSA66_13415 [Roseiarcus sp.]|jgi:hypothetical protein